MKRMQESTADRGTAETEGLQTEEKRTRCLKMRRELGRTQVCDGGRGGTKGTRVRMPGECGADGGAHKPGLCRSSD